MKVYNYKTKGFSLVEVILASALFGMIVMAILGGIAYAQQEIANSGMRSRGVMVAEEGIEALQSIRDSNFDLISAGLYGVSNTNGFWELVALSDTVDGYTRVIEITEVDEHMRDVLVIVSWQQGGVVKDISLVATLTNWAGMGRLDWVAPSFASNIDIPGGNAGSKIQAGFGYTYLVRVNGDPDFISVDVRDVLNPVVAGTLSIGGNPINIAVEGDYAYVVTADNGGELQVVDISDPVNLSVISSYDAPGPQQAYGVDVSGDYVAITRGFNNSTEFIYLDISDPFNPVFVGSTSLKGDSLEVIILGDYAYVATENNVREMQVVDLTDPLLPTVIAWHDTPGNSNALSITGYDDTVVLGHSDGNVYIFDVSVPSNPVLTSTYPVGGAVNDLSMGYDNTYVFIASNSPSKEFLVLNVEDLLNITEVGTADLVSAVNGVVYDPNNNRAYMAGSGNDEEFMIIAPQ